MTIWCNVYRRHCTPFYDCVLINHDYLSLLWCFIIYLITYEFILSLGDNDIAGLLSIQLIFIPSLRAAQSVPTSCVGCTCGQHICVIPQSLIFALIHWTSTFRLFRSNWHHDQGKGLIYVCSDYLGIACCLYLPGYRLLLVMCLHFIVIWR